MDIKTSNMEEFEKQLEQSNVLDLNNEILNENKLEENKINSIDLESVPKTNIPNIPNMPLNSTNLEEHNKLNQKIVKIPKNLVLAFQSDSTGCGFIRCHQPFSYLQFMFGKVGALVPFPVLTFIYQADILMRCRALYFQRQMAPQHLQNIKTYKDHQKQFGYKMIWEIDDHIWWEDKERKIHGVPPYNFGATGITEDVKKASIEIMNMMDLLTVSTEFLAHYIKNELGVKVPIKVIPNHVAKFLWKNEPKKPITEKIQKPKIIYTGSPTHYHNEKRLAGDWQDGGWMEYIIKNVKDKKIDFTCMGGLPWFFQEIKDKIKVYNWVNSFHYHLAILGEKADFGIMPLTINNFNRSKSDLKMREYYAGDIFAIGSYFKEEEWKGPYSIMKNKLPHNSSVKEIEEMIDFNSRPENYNSTLEHQRDWMNNNMGWMESKGWINNFLKIFE